MLKSRRKFAMNNNSLEQLKKEYINIPIPKELDNIVNAAIKNSRAASSKGKNSFKRAAIIAASTAAAIGILTVGINTSPAFALALSKVPVVGSLVKVLTFKEYTVNEDKYKADIKVPQIQGLENKALENSLNEKYLKENQQLYESFIGDMEAMKEKGGGHLGVNSGYVVKTDTDKILSVGRYVVNTVGSSSTTFKYDTIDKKKEILITLPILFKDDSYVNVISENIIAQMKEQMKKGENKTYWIADNPKIGKLKPFEKISREQNFYINPEGKLVISFNKYEVAAGYMGTPEFVIPTEVISNILVGGEYIK
jgi:hypothetical protein